MNLQIRQAAAMLSGNNGKADQALKLLHSQSKKKNPDWQVFHYGGKAYYQKKQYPKALAFLKQVLARGGGNAETHQLIAACQLHLQQLDDAEQSCRTALGMDDRFFEGWMTMGDIHRAQARLDDALNSYMRANQLDQRNLEVAMRAAQIYQDQGNYKKALELYNLVIENDSGNMDAWLNKATVLRSAKQPKMAIDCLKEAIEIKPRDLSTRALLALVLKDQGLFKEALEHYENLVDEFPKNGFLRSNYALCLQELARYGDAEKNYLRAFEDTPEAVKAFSNYLMVLHYNPERTREEIFREHLKWDRHFAPKERPQRPLPENRDPGRRLRVGFISGGFRAHPVGWMITLGLENLSKEHFEIYCYTTDSKVDDVTRRLHAATDKWQSVIGYSDKVVAGMIRKDEIDILVELSGHSADNRLGTVALEPAPVSIKWVGGLFNTSGLASMDYLLTDWYESPSGEEPWYTEKLLRMPDDYICFLPPDYSPDVGPLPFKKKGYITFGCFNNPIKVNNELLGHWAELMHRVPESRLLLKSKQYSTKIFTDRILERLEECGIGRDRVILEGQSPHMQLLDTYNRVDVALDPWPYSGGVTTCEALWMGVPVVTLPGPTFAGRHSASHLVNAGLPDLVVKNWEEYIGKAAELASDPEALALVRTGLREQVRHSPLCDGKRFGSHLGMAFREMWKQWVKGHEDEDEDEVLSGLADETPDTSEILSEDTGLPEESGGSEESAAAASDWRDHIAIQALPVEEKPAAGKVLEPEAKKSVSASDTEHEPEPEPEKSVTDPGSDLEAGPEKSALAPEPVSEESTSKLDPVKDAPESSSESESTSEKDASEPLSEEHAPETPLETQETTHTPEDGIRKISIHDGVTICVPDNLRLPTTFILMEQGQWIDEELSFVRDFLKPGMKVVDAGAGFGVYSLPMAKKVGPSGRVYAFEPVEEAHSCLSRSKKENTAGQLEILSQVLGAEAGDARLQVSDIPEASRLDDEGNKEVSLTTLDQWWSGQGETAIDLIKIDVNGTELKVLKGAHALLQGASPVVIVALNKETTVAALSEEMAPLGYQMFTYVPGPGLLAEYDQEEGHDSSLQNLVLVPESRIDELKQSGLIYDENREPVEAREGIWLETLRALPWSETLVEKWEARASEEENREYLKALDHIYTAEKLMDRGDGGTRDRTACAMLLVGAADILIGRYNDGDHSVELTLTLSRLLKMLGKTTQPLEMIARQMADARQTGSGHDPSLPFLLPLKSQDNLAVHTDIRRWLNVRLVETWLLFFDRSSAFMNEHQFRMLQVLDGNPEAGPEIKQRIRMHKLLTGEPVEEEETGRDSVQETGQHISPSGAQVNGQEAIEDTDRDIVQSTGKATDPDASTSESIAAEEPATAEPAVEKEEKEIETLATGEATEEKTDPARKETSSHGVAPKSDSVLFRKPEKDEAKIELPSEVSRINLGIKDAKGEKIRVLIPDSEYFRIAHIFENHEYALPRGHKLREKAVVVDIGANVGVFSLYADRWARDVQLHCFEPNPQVHGMLEENLKHTQNAELYHVGLSDRDGELMLYQHPENTGEASTSFRHEGAKKVPVPVVHAGRAFKEIGLKQVDVLKIDTEGAEVAILKALEDFLPDVSVVMVEYHTEEDRIAIDSLMKDFQLYSANVDGLTGIGTVKYVKKSMIKRVKA